MASVSQKYFARQYLDAIQTKDTSSFYTIVHPDYEPSISKMPTTTLEIIHNLKVQDYHGIDNLRDRFTKFHQIWDNISITDLEMISEGNVVVAYYTMHYTHVGPVLGIQPTKKRVSVQSYHHFTFKDGKIIKVHMMQDFFSVIRQIGLELYENESQLIREYLDALSNDKKFDLGATH